MASNNRQSLIFDADDTLWENNIYFERAIAAFISYLDHRVHSPEEVREHLNACEHATIAAHGYGLKSFRRSLVTCFEQLSDQPITPEKHDRIVGFTDCVADHQIELLPITSPQRELQEVALYYLTSVRDRLFLVTDTRQVDWRKPEASARLPRAAAGLSLTPRRPPHTALLSSSTRRARPRLRASPAIGRIFLARVRDASALVSQVVAFGGARSQ